ncbi:putative pyridoxal phosphate enzyme, YggS family [Gottschalkia acidurici 9a]|uniref:Pyridoxal phosphate homeostasis protein n=1 Tax=Gottschalkia acidurici (strain ATCC 7906 / DSM 604 / BCRC 14475 / CIP 104303 / KCTC 5404 / NCIMB 10678 / 9a) TaxID=1128398 RepID=K0AZL1_GOTA9|nr:YggS family pyridoxal phosphate-dependent enzyme [Gottschalkia acidurici]AFS78709.1 putative pyridoxal phosphate enzyme, YggS family [Gottschalkia acidurici 9a]
MEAIKISIKENLLYINDKINEIAKNKGISSEDITLIGVTKTIDVDRINESISLGIANIGENKVQEIQEKYDKIKGDVKWHMIGHLQTNKVKYIIDKVELIHSLDRKSLADEIQKRASQNNIVAKVLVQVNVAEEESKFGLKLEEAISFIESIQNYKNIKIKGLMTMAPYEEDTEKVRFVFRELKKLFETIKEKINENVDMKYLSMGMTNDYDIALEEGANMIRVGTGVFGERIYK